MIKAVLTTDTNKSAEEEGPIGDREDQDLAFVDFAANSAIPSCYLSFVLFNLLHGFDGLQFFIVRIHFTSRTDIWNVRIDSKESTTDSSAEK